MLLLWQLLWLFSSLVLLLQPLRLHLVVNQLSGWVPMCCECAMVHIIIASCFAVQLLLPPTWHVCPHHQALPQVLCHTRLTSMCLLLLLLLLLHVSLGLLHYQILPPLDSHKFPLFIKLLLNHVIISFLCC